MNTNFFYEKKHHFKRFQLFVNNLPAFTDYYQLKQFFSYWAQVKQIKIIQHHLNSVSASIDFFTFQEMMNALENSNGVLVNGMIIKVQPSKNAIVICHCCHQIGHWKDSCRLTSKKGAKCFSCHKSGHISRDCPVNIGKNRGKYNKLKGRSQPQAERQFEKRFIQKVRYHGANQKNDHYQENFLEQTHFQSDIQMDQQLSFVKILSSKSSCQQLYEEQRENRINELWNSQLYRSFEDEDGPFVRISSQ